MLKATRILPARELGLRPLQKGMETVSKTQVVMPARIMDAQS
jgi:hypothetical protein